MNREIKFRAYIHPHCGGNVPQEMYGQMDYSEGKDLSSFFELYNPSFFEIMQFTGLHDKNGKEIYEGDILTANEYPYKDEGEYNYHAVVGWLYSSWQTVPRCVNPKKSGISDGINETMEFEAGETTDYEVIGNIHEHKELLK